MKLKEAKRTAIEAGLFNVLTVNHAHVNRRIEFGGVKKISWLKSCLKSTWWITDLHRHEREGTIQKHLEGGFRDEALAYFYCHYNCT